MNLRELMIERIMYAIEEENLMEVYDLSEKDLPTIPDEDLLEIYEDTAVMMQCDHMFNRSGNMTLI